MSAPRLLNLTVTYAEGLEELLRRELTDLGVDVPPKTKRSDEDDHDRRDSKSKHSKSHDKRDGSQRHDREGGRLRVQVTLEQAYRILLWSRLASRVWLEVFRSPVEAGPHDNRDVAEELYRAAREFDWSLIFPVDSTFAVRVQADPAIAVNPRFATLRVKDGVVDSFREMSGERPSVDGEQPDIGVVALAGEREHRFLIDLSGESLHRRGYREAMTDAPLKENLAAALLQSADWPSNFEGLVDPMCGSGTLLIEAMQRWQDRAPALARARGQTHDRFGFERWRGHDPALWQSMVDEAEQRLVAGQAKPLPTLIALDSQPKAITATRQNWRAAGLEDALPALNLQASALNDWTQEPSRLGELPERLLVITNPPYGERLGEASQNRAVYQGLGGALQSAFAGQKAAVLAARVEAADVLPLAEPTTQKFYNGSMPVYLRQGTIQAPTPSTLLADWQAPREIHTDELDKGADDFANRLIKNITALKKQAQREGVTNLRIYDADLPEFNLAVDLYGDNVHVQEYAPPKTIDPEKAQLRFRSALAVLRQVLGVSREQVFIKTRARQAGNQQYTRKTDDGKADSRRRVVHEGNGQFYVNLSDYLDTGLFLDHRPLRTQVGQEAAGKKVLNLFAYTCSASVHAALGEAKSVISVDLSPTYLAWGQDNFVLNGLDLDSGRYRFFNQDVFEWLKDDTGLYDVIFLDPPTFSNSKKFAGTFEIQRDQGALLRLALKRLAPDGVLYFSTNYRKFELDHESLPHNVTVKNITPQTIGFDYKRSQGIHQAWELRHA